MGLIGAACVLLAASPATGAQSTGEPATADDPAGASAAPTGSPEPEAAMEPQTDERLSVDLAAAARGLHHQATLTLFTENDGGILKRNNPTDRYYTAGNAASLTFHEPRWADDIARRVYGDQRARRRDNAGGVFGGQLMFTPEDLAATDLIEDDRPYAGYLYGGAFWQSANERALDHVRIELGVVGPASLADDTQKWVHTVYGGDDPRGWSNQLDNEPTIQGYYQRKWRFREERLGLDDLPGELEVLPEFGVALGTVRRHLEAGATLRYGVNLPTNFGPARLDDLSGTAKTLQRGFGAYGFVRGAGRAVQHDMFLEGNNFETSHSVEPERLVGRIQAGVQISYQHEFWSLELGYSQTFITRQFEQQDGSHAYASLTAAMTMWF